MIDVIVHKNKTSSWDIQPLTDKAKDQLSHLTSGLKPDGLVTYPSNDIEDMLKHRKLEYKFANNEFYRHFRGPVVGTAYGVFEDGLLKLSVSVCSPEDQFCKKTGRELAKKRMEIAPCMTISTALLNSKDATRRYTSRRVLFNDVSEICMHVFASCTPLLPSIKNEANI